MPVPGAANRGALSLTAIANAALDDPLVQSIAAHEGFRAVPYLDSVNVWTVGYGYNLQVGMTRTEAMLLALARLEASDEELQRRAPWIWALDPVRRDVLRELAYVMGVSGVLRFTQMLGAMQSGRWSDAKRNLLASKFASQVGHRAETLADRLESGVWA